MSKKDTSAEDQAQDGWDVSMEVRRKPGTCWTQKPGKTSSRDGEPWCLCEEKSGTCYKHEQAHFWPWVKHVLCVAGAEAGCGGWKSKWEVRPCRPFAQTSLWRRLAVNGRHTVVAKGNSKCRERQGGRNEHIYGLREKIGKMETFKQTGEGVTYNISFLTRLEGMR